MKKSFVESIMVGGRQPYKGGYSSNAPRRQPSHYERTKAQVYATGNKWAIENFEATH